MKYNSYLWKHWCYILSYLDNRAATCCLVSFTYIYVCVWSRVHVCWLPQSSWYSATNIPHSLFYHIRRCASLAAKECKVGAKGRGMAQIQREYQPWKKEQSKGGNERMLGSWLPVTFFKILICKVTLVSILIVKVVALSSWHLYHSATFVFFVQKLWIHFKELVLLLSKC